jgi:hypothetical protein
VEAFVHTMTKADALSKTTAETLVARARAMIPPMPAVPRRHDGNGACQQKQSSIWKRPDSFAFFGPLVGAVTK